MTTHTARMSATPNQTVTAKLFASTGIADTVLFTSSPAVTGQPNNGTSYLPVFTNVTAGTYKIVLYNAGGTVLSDGYGVFTGVDLETVEILPVPNPATEIAEINDKAGYCLAILAGAISDAGTAAETYVLTVGGVTYTADYTGLDSTGNRSITTLSKV